MNRRPILYGIAVALAAALVVIATPAGAQWVTNFFGRTFTSSAPSGVNGFACKVSGCRIDLGPGAGDHMYGSGGTAIIASGTLQAVTAVNAPQFWGQYHFGNATDIRLRGNAADGATANSVLIGAAPSLTAAGAKLLALYPDNFSTLVASIDKDGTGVFQGAVQANTKLISPAAVILPSTLGTCQAGEEGRITTVAGAGAVKTKLCVCTYTPTGTVYAWVNALANNTGTGVGNATTCP